MRQLSVFRLVFIITIILLALMPFTSMFLRRTFDLHFSAFFGPLFLMLILMLFSEALTPYRDSIRFPLYLRFYALFLVVLLLWTYDVAYSSPRSTVFTLVKSGSFQAFYIFLLIENYDFSKRFKNNVTLLIKFVLLATFVVLLIQVFYDKHFMVSEAFRYSYRGQASGISYRFPSIFSWIHSSALGLTVPILFALIVPGFKGHRLESAFYFIMVLIIVILAKSRYIMVSFLIVLTLYSQTKGLLLIRIFRYALFIALSILIVYLGGKLFGVDMDYFIRNRILSNSANSRLLAFEMFFKFFPENLLFGTGGIKTNELMQEIAGRSSQIHVGWLSLFYYYGIIGGIFYLGFMGTLLHHLWKIGKTLGQWAPFVALSTFVAANFTLVYLVPFDMGLIMLIVFKRYYDQQLYELKTASEKAPAPTPLQTDLLET